MNNYPEIHYKSRDIDWFEREIRNPFDTMEWRTIAQAGPLDCVQLAEASDRIPSYFAANSMLVAGRRSELSERLGVGMDKQIPVQFAPSRGAWIGVRNALVILAAMALLAWGIVRVIHG